MELFPSIASEGLYFTIWTRFVTRFADMGESRLLHPRGRKPPSWANNIHQA